MAEKLTAVDGGQPDNEPVVELNSAARADTIQSVCRDMQNLDDRIADLQAEKREIKNKKIKGDLGMKVSDFNIAYRLYKLEQGDRDQLLDTVRETFEALGVGEQLDWLKAQDRATAAQ